MSSIYADSLRLAIETADNAAAVGLLEDRVKEGSTTEVEALLCGVLLLMPPLADYEVAASIFSRLLPGERGFEAAVWDAYRFSVLLPDGDRAFEAVLRSQPRSAIATHMLSMVASADGDAPRALIENRTSRALRLFPFNIVEALKRDFSMPASERDCLWRIACDLVTSRCAESDAGVSTVEGALQRRWDNLIVGTRLTSPLWEDYTSKFGGS
jgi:hypothetical protein